MGTKKSVSQLTIKGFKSIRELEDFPLGTLNVMIGPNGAGKSNLVSYFRMLGEMVESRLQKWVTRQGSADRILSFGIKETERIESYIEFGLNGYRFELEATVDGDFFFAGERLFLDGPKFGPKWEDLGSGHKESALKKKSELEGKESIADYCYNSISSWKVYHFHDTGETAGVKRYCSLHDDEYLRSDASNLAAYLFKLKNDHPDVYGSITKTIKLAVPSFDRFVLKPRKIRGGEEQIRLLWRQKDSDYSLWPSQLSDGTIRFICLVTALLQPDPPSTVIVDEPELGLHPYAITLLGSLLRSASKRMQVIVSTQSVPLIDEFSIRDLIVVEQKKGETLFSRHTEKEFKLWLEEYSVGELWRKNILGGRP